jgi:hypothetical protein
MSRLLKASALLALGFISALALMRDGAHAERGEAVTTVDLPIQELRLFSEVLGIIRQNYAKHFAEQAQCLALFARTMWSRSPTVTCSRVPFAAC